MKAQTCGYTFSLLSHGVFLGIFLALGNVFVEPEPPIRIDFRYEAEPAGHPRPAPALTAPAPSKVPKKMAHMRVARPMLPPPIPPVETLDAQPPPEAIVAQQTLETLEPMTAQTFPGEAASIDEASAEEETFAQSEYVAAQSTSIPDEGGTAGSPFSDPQARYLKAHYEYIKNDIQRQLIYPVVARRKGWQGRVVVSFVICETGQVMDVRVVESSGVALLDNSAVLTILQAGPFAPPPHRAELVVPVNYLLG